MIGNLIYYYDYWDEIEFEDWRLVVLNKSDIGWVEMFWVGLEIVYCVD